MKDNCFLDTNIIIYAFNTDSNKSLIAKNILVYKNPIISYQVIQEFCNIALNKSKLNMSIERCRRFVNNLLVPICMVYSSPDLFNIALDIKFETNYSYYDCLILAAAYISNCNIVYSEDMQSNHEIRNMRIVNPFTEL